VLARRERASLVLNAAFAHRCERRVGGGRKKSKMIFMTGLLERKEKNSESIMDGCSVMLCFVGITFPRDFLQATFSFVEE
jgi:hypothetical protein